ncbi:MAG TPA: hypothetical protein VNM50_10310 [Chloroflexota bacterium]|nr:hypothetical protein [Chloroflexota bacterium]
MQEDISRRQAQVAEAEHAVLAYHRRLHGAGPYAARGRVRRGC